MLQVHLLIMVVVEPVWEYVQTIALVPVVMNVLVVVRILMGILMQKILDREQSEFMVLQTIIVVTAVQVDALVVVEAVLDVCMDVKDH